MARLEFKSGKTWAIGQLCYARIKVTKGLAGPQI